MLDFLKDLVGVGQEDANAVQMASRALIVYVFALVMVRWGEKRFMGKSTAFDVILGVILGSVVSRAINSGAALVPTIVAGFVLVGLHWTMAHLAFRSDRFGNLVKGHTRILVKDGEVNWEQMRASHMSRDDLLGALRAQGNVGGWEQVEEARLERSGEISVIKASKEPKILKAVSEDGKLAITIKLT